MESPSLVNRKFIRTLCWVVLSGVVLIAALRASYEITVVIHNKLHELNDKPVLEVGAYKVSTVPCETITQCKDEEVGNKIPLPPLCIGDYIPFIVQHKPKGVEHERARD